ncbi:MAG: 8-amino-7-oxononanoate synthase, partial [Desulfovibrio sp.]|nr:8-amino-7-oxononanoate synthase [Desulfovibrio sp.]
GYAIVPVIVGDSMVAGFLSQSLFKSCIYVMPVAFPAVKEGLARLRFFISAAHTEDLVKKTLDAVVEELPKAKKIVDDYRKEHGDAYAESED